MPCTVNNPPYWARLANPVRNSSLSGMPCILAMHLYCCCNTGEAMYSSQDHTFVVCAYKTSPYLRECLESLLKQTIQTHVLVTTSTPTEETRAVCASLGVELVTRDGESGLANDWNFAVDTATTPLVTIAHQDDVYKPNYAETLLTSLKNTEDLLMFFSNYGELRDGQEVDDNPNLRVKRRMLAPLAKTGSSNIRGVKRSIMRLGNSICCPSVTLNKERIPLPLFKKGLSSNLDWEAWERLANTSGSFVYSSKILMLHRIHGGSETSRIIDDGNRTKEDLVMLEKFWPTPIAQFINSFYRMAQKSNG